MGTRRQPALEKELLKIQKEEEKLQKAATRDGHAGWKAGIGNKIEHKIPDKARRGLEKAFCKAFATVFGKGTAWIEKLFHKDTMAKDYEIRDYAVRLKGGRKEIRKLRKDFKKTDRHNMAVTAVEGIGLGALGVGLPDIVLFTGMLLKGVYEAALSYGIDYEKPEERLFILMMLEAALAKGEQWIDANEAVDKYIEGHPYRKGQTAEEQAHALPTQEMLQKQMERTAGAFASDMLLLKAVQGIPVVGILGGAANPVYYRKVMRYVGVKYQKRYLRMLEGRQ